jgi:GT2 family glycosyltransferase
MSQSRHSVQRRAIRPDTVVDAGRVDAKIPRITFIVPVRNDAVRLETCLRSIRRSAGTSDYHEIIVVDNGSTDGSGDVARRLGATVLTIGDNVKVSELRNTAARHAAGDIFAFIDADNEIVSAWTHAAIEVLRLPAVGAVGALYLAPHNGTWVQRAYGYLRGRAEAQHDIDWLGSGNIAVWRTAFESVGGFDTSLETCEDVDFCQRLRASGARLVSDARLESTHHGDPETLSDLFVAERWRGRDNVRVSLRGPISWSSLPSAVIPIVDIAMIAAAVLGVLGMFTSLWYGLIVVFAALAIITGGAWLRVIRIVVRDRAVRGVAILQVLAVACVYDVGRALALVTPTPHRAVRAVARRPAS